MVTGAHASFVCMLFKQSCPIYSQNEPVSFWSGVSLCVCEGRCALVCPAYTAVVIDLVWAGHLFFHGLSRAAGGGFLSVGHGFTVLVYCVVRVYVFVYCTVRVRRAVPNNTVKAVYTVSVMYTDRHASHAAP